MFGETEPSGNDGERGDGGGLEKVRAGGRCGAIAKGFEGGEEHVRRDADERDEGGDQMNLPPERGCFCVPDALDCDDEAGENADDKAEERDVSEEDGLRERAVAVLPQVRHAVKDQRRSNEQTGGGMQNDAPLRDGVKGIKGDEEAGDDFEEEAGHGNFG